MSGKRERVVLSEEPRPPGVEPGVRRAASTLGTTVIIGVQHLKCGLWVWPRGCYEVVTLDRAEAARLLPLLERFVGEES